MLKGWWVIIKKEAHHLWVRLPTTNPYSRASCQFCIAPGIALLVPLFLLLAPTSARRPALIDV